MLCHTDNSLFDVLNEEKNTATLVLSRYTQLLEAEGYEFDVFRLQGFNTNATLLDFIVEKQFDYVYIGEEVYASSHTDDNYIFMFAAKIKQYT